ncbi:MAG: hypothetical protein JWO11_4116 [Nocardioides sp.]|nr:hypothetical protein [Nocardioides sp.]
MSAALTFGTAHRGHHIQLPTQPGEWLTLMEEPRPCPHGCCRVAYAFTGVAGRPELVHAAASTPITVLAAPGGTR